MMSRPTFSCSGLDGQKSLTMVDETADLSWSGSGGGAVCVPGVRSAGGADGMVKPLTFVTLRQRAPSEARMVVGSDRGDSTRCDRGFARDAAETSKPVRSRWEQDVTSCAPE